MNAPHPDLTHMSPAKTPPAPSAQELQNQIADLQHQMAQMQRSKFWKLGMAYWALRARLLGVLTAGAPPAGALAAETGVAQTIEPAAPAAPEAQVRPPRQPATSGVFVFGCPRSGTSILSWCLAAHSDFWTSEESDFLHHLFGRGLLRRAYQTATARPDRGFMPVNGVTYAEYAAALGLGIDQLFRSRSDGRRWVNSDPGYVLMANDLAYMFPEARFIVIERDGRAVVSSMLNSGFDEAWATDIRLACENWVHYVREGRQFAQHQPERCRRVSLENLSTDPATFDMLLSFLEASPGDLPWQYIQNNRINSSYGNAAPGDIRKSKDPKSRPQAPWRQWSAADKKTFVAVCGATMLELGYPMDLD